MRLTVNPARQFPFTRCLTLLLLLAGVCQTAVAQTQVDGPSSDYPVTIGDSYSIDGVSYSPIDSLNYDAVGYAQPGEGKGISGAHHVLPVPSYVEVTALATGHTILVRIDRRGPMTSNRLIELSPAAWARLGLAPGAGAAVRVRRVNPPENERALLRLGQSVPAPIDTPPGLLNALKRKLGLDDPARTIDENATTVLAGIPSGLAPGRVAAVQPPIANPPAPIAVSQPAPPETRIVKPNPVPSPMKVALPEPKAALAVQVGAFATRANAARAAAQVGGAVEPAGKLWRVRITAQSRTEAEAALAKAHRAGYADARIVPTS